MNHHRRRIENAFRFLSYATILALVSPLRDPAGKQHFQVAPTPYPNSFRISFETNLTTASSTDIIFPIRGELFYEWSLQSQRVDHAAGSYECVHIYQTNHACSLYFLDRGMYRVIWGGRNQSSAGAFDCCLDLAGIGTPPPDWAARANPTFDGIVFDEYSRLLAYQWTFDHLQLSSSHRTNSIRNENDRVSKYHSAREVAFGELGGRPLLFSFPGEALGTQDYHYIVDSMMVGPQSPSLFQLPEGCADILCEAPENPLPS